MQIKDLPSSSTLAASDVLAKDTSSGTTQKITAAQFAADVKVLADLQGKLTFDSTPTAGSTNPVTSAGIATAIQQSTATAFTQKDESASNIVSTGSEVVVTTKTITSPKASSNVLIVYSAPIKTSANTSTLYIKVDDTIVGNPMSTNQIAFITVTGFALASMTAGSHTVKLCMKSQNSSTTGTIPSYNSVAFAVVVL